MNICEVKQQVVAKHLLEGVALVNIFRVEIVWPVLENCLLFEFIHELLVGGINFLGIFVDLFGQPAQFLFLAVEQLLAVNLGEGDESGSAHLDLVFALGIW